MGFSVAAIRDVASRSVFTCERLRKAPKDRQQPRQTQNSAGDN